MHRSNNPCFIRACNLSKQQRERGRDEDLLFSQSELAELDAELAPQADEAALASAQTPAQASPPSLDDLVDSAFSDEETAEKQLQLSSDVDLSAGFVGFVEAEPATTGEIMAAMAEQPISSAPALDEPSRDSSRPTVAVGEISGSATTPSSSDQELPSVIFDDSPFGEGDMATSQDPGEIVPQLAALAAAIDTRQQRSLPLGDTVLSSSPPPTADSLQVEVVAAGGGSLPNLRAPALVALTHTVEDGLEHNHAEAIGSATTAPAPEQPSGHTPVVSLADHEFQLMEDSEEHLVVPDVESESENLVAPLLSNEDSGPVLAFEETPASSDEVDGAPQDTAIDDAWSEVAEDDDRSTQSAAAEDLQSIDSSSDMADGVAEGPADLELPLSARVTPVLGIPTVPGASGSEVADEIEPDRMLDTTPTALSADMLPTAGQDDLLDVEPAETGAALGAFAATAAGLDATAESRISPAREPNAPPIPRDALRRTSPGVAPPPPPPAAMSSAQKSAAGAAGPPRMPAAATTSASSAAARTATPPPHAVPPGGLNFGEETKLRKKRRSKQWFEEIFDEDYLHTLPFMTPHQTEREVAFLLEALELPTGGRVLDIGCGYGRHAMEMASRGYRTVGLDLSLPLLIRATDAARHRSVNVDFVHGDMRDMSFDGEFDGAYCFFTTFGYFDDDTNRRVASGICRALKPGGRLVLELINRDYLIGDLPTRVWWQGDGCVVLEEVDFNYFTSRLQVQRQIILESGRQLEQEISIRAYSLHEIGKVLHHAGFRVLEVSGSLELRGRFYGNESRQLVVVAERRAQDG